MSCALGKVITGEAVVEVIDYLGGIAATSVMLGVLSSCSIEHERRLRVVENAEVVRLTLPPGVHVDDRKVVVVEFGSFACPYCQVFNREMLGWLDSTYVQKELVRFLYTEMSEQSSDVAVPVNCAEAGRLREVQLAVEKMLSDSGGIGSDGGELQGLARDNEATCYRVWQEKGIAERLRTAGARLGVRRTPTFVVGRVRRSDTIVGWVVEGLRPQAIMEAFVESALNVR